MVNNIGYTTTKLTQTIGDMTTFGTTDTIATIGTISGNLGIGYILFDDLGTIAVCTSVDNTSFDNPIYSFKTSSVSGEVTIVTTDEEYENLIPGQLFVDDREENTNG